jgi:hypothetical protein
VPFYFTQTVLPGATGCQCADLVAICATSLVCARGTKLLVCLRSEMLLDHMVYTMYLGWELQSERGTNLLL